MQVRLLSLGATVHSVIYPGEGAEEARDVVMGFDKVSKKSSWTFTPFN